MFLFSLKLHLRTAAATWQTFGFGREMLVYAVRRPLATAVMQVFLALDHVFVPRFKRVEVREPVFIMGHPRSGTTLLQHALTQCREFCDFETWEIFVPSLVARRLVKRMIARRIREGRTTYLPAATGHAIALDQVEEDELLFLVNGNTQVLTIHTPLGFGDRDFTELVHADDQPERIRRQTVAFLKRCFQRQIYATGKTRVVAKLTYSGMRLRSLLRAFPDAKIVYVVRSPLETIPSHLSLHRNLFEHRWSLARVPRARLARFYERRYKHNVAYYRYLEDLIESGELPSAQFMVVPYDALREDLVATVGKIARFAGLALSDELERRIAEQGGEQKAYVRSHRNLGLEEFGLTEERIRKDLAFVFDRYGFDK